MATPFLDGRENRSPPRPRQYVSTDRAFPRSAKPGRRSPHQAPTPPPTVCAQGHAMPTLFSTVEKIGRRPRPRQYVSTDRAFRGRRNRVAGHRIGLRRPRRLCARKGTRCRCFSRRSRKSVVAPPAPICEHGSSFAFRRSAKPGRRSPHQAPTPRPRRLCARAPACDCVHVCLRGLSFKLARRWLDS